MVDILHRVGIATPASDVYRALTTIPGLRGWWIGETTGSAEEGGVISFLFSKMRVVELKPGQSVRWLCIEGPSEWIGTTISFQMEWKDGQTFVLFTHANWKEPVEFMHHCSTKWAVFLLSLKDALERGAGRPTPNDVKIHVGD